MRKVWLAVVVVVVVFIALLLIRGGAGEATRGGPGYTINVTVTEGPPCTGTIADLQKIVALAPGESASLTIANADPLKNCAGGSITLRRFRHKVFKGGFCWASTNADEEFELGRATFTARRGNPHGRRDRHRYCYTAELVAKDGTRAEIDPETEIIWP